MWIPLYSLLGIHSVADVVRCGRLRWFGQLEHKIGDDLGPPNKYPYVDDTARTRYGLIPNTVTVNMD